MPPPPPPYVAPDVRPIATTDRARLTFVRDASGRLRDITLESGVWLAVEGAPLEVRMHKRDDGTTWAEQAFYEAGDRANGIARVSASASTAVVSRRIVGSVGTLRNLVRYTVRDGAGTVVRTWMGDQCGVADTARLDRADSPDEPTYPPSYGDCGEFGGFSGAYVLGRVVGIDRGWATRAVTTPPRATLAAGRYQLQVEYDPIQALADANRANHSVTVPLVVRTVRVAEAPGPVEEGGGLEPAPPAGAGALARLRALERAVDAQVARAGRAARLDTPSGYDLPDLRQAPSYGIEVVTRRLASRGRRDFLLFGSLTWNAGPGRLEVEAFREGGDVLRAYQVFHRDGERAGREQRGTMVWHAGRGHDHFHFHSFAHYSLTRMDGTLVKDAGKHSWCIVDTDLVDTTVPGAVGGDRGAPMSGGCGMDPGALWARLSMSVGAGDYYGPGTSGQAIDITGMPNGLYRIRLEANPSRVLAESNYDNNVATRVVRIGGVPGRRSVTPRPVKTIDEGATGGFEGV